MDDGAGHEALVRLTNLNGGDNLNGGGDIIIPPRGVVVITDDIATFKEQFGDGGGVTILQMKGEFPSWYFAPGVGRMKLAYGNDPERDNYDDPSLTGPVVNGVQQAIEEIPFSVVNGGAAWLPSQALSRQGPIGTGFLAVEPFPHIGLIPPYEAGYWWVDLGAFVAPALTDSLPATGLGSDRIRVDNTDAYTDHGLGTMQATGERIWWTGKEGGALIVHERAIQGTALTSHDAGEWFVPDSLGGALQNSGLRQQGWNVDQIELRRKPSGVNGLGERTPPQIVAGAVIASNMVAPGNPSEGGSRWEQHPDWFLVQRFSERTGSNPDVITLNLRDILGGPRELRHIAIQVGTMGRVNGLPQRAKHLVYMTAWEWGAAGDAGGGWASHQVGDVAGAVAHLLTQHAGVPASKVIPLPRSQPIGDLTLTGGTASAQLDAVTKNDGIRVRLDRANNAIIEPTPVNPAYAPTAPLWTWTPDLIRGDLSATWGVARKVAQARVRGRSVSDLRNYSARYPRLPGSLGGIVEINDVRVLNGQQAQDRAQMEFRAGNARRTLTIPAGALPWVEVGQRHLLNLPNLDRGGQMFSINVVVTGYGMSIGIDDGGVTCETSVSVQELTL